MSKIPKKQEERIIRIKKIIKKMGGGQKEWDQIKKLFLDIIENVK